MSVTITFLLSTEGQKASLLAGGDGKQKQTIEVGRDDPAFADVVRLGTPDASGDIRLDASNYYRPRPDWCHVQPVFDEVAWTAAAVVRRLEAELAQADAEAKERKRQEAEQAAKMAADDAAKLAEWAAMPVSERIERTSCSGSANWVPRRPHLHYPLTNDHPLLAEARAEAERLNQQEAAEREAAEAMAAEAKRLRLEAQGLEDGDLVLVVEDGALTKVPLWESHSRGKNWCATIKSDPTKPGGLDRSFWERAKGAYYYLVPEGLAVGTPVEFGADYYTGGGRPNRKRWYGIVIRVQADQLVVRPRKTGKGAIRDSAEYRVQEEPAPIEDLVDQGLARINGEGVIDAAGN